jgi:hypothetical protein
LYPYPTVDVTRYWNYVAYNYGSTNIAFFGVQDGKCKNFIDQSSGLYTAYCDDSTGLFYLTINNVTDVYNGRTIQCTVAYSTGTSSQIQSLINVQNRIITLFGFIFRRIFNI